MLEFEADLDCVYVQGVDILVSFTVTVHPKHGLQKQAELMALQLTVGQD